MNDGLISPENPTMTLRVVYFGTPDYAIPALGRLCADPRVDLRLVVTQPERPAGRRHQLTPPPVKIAAERLGLKVYQPQSLRTPEAREPLVQAEADFFIVAAYGLIFGQKTLAIPRIASLNLHASILPRYRGASPVAASILAGDIETGVSLMQMDRGLDTGPVFVVARTAIERNDSTASLTGRLAELGADLIGEHLVSIARRELDPVPQPAQGASITRPLTKMDGAIDWTQPAERIERHIRAMWPWPRAWTERGGTRVQIHRAHAGEGDLAGPPGTVVAVQGQPVVACGMGVLRLEALQEPGGTAVSGEAWMAGQRGNTPQFETSAEVMARPPITILL